MSTDRLRGTRVPTRERWIAVGLFVVAALMRLPFRSEFLVNWDAVNFALGIEAFDLGHHQPHAPGYIGYILLGRGLALLTGDTNAALTLLSALGGGVLVAFAYLLARRMVRRNAALLTAVLLGTAPVVWYYSSVALTYVVGAAAVVAAAWAAHVAITDRSRWHLFALAIALSILGALRQTDIVLLLPIALLAASRFRWRDRFAAAGVLGATAALWATPLLVDAGGVHGFLHLARDLADVTGSRTWIFGMNPVGMLQNVGLVGIGLVLGLTAALLAWPLALAVRSGDGLAREDRRLLRWWVVPALLVFLLLHTGQIGYVLLVLPALMIRLIAAGDRAVTALRERQARRVPTLSATPTPVTGLLRTRRGIVGATALVAVNATAAVAIPTAGVALVADDGAGAGATGIADDKVTERTRQYLIRESDAYWETAVEFAERFDPDRSAVLAVPTSAGTFRHLAYYLDDHTVYGVGHDLHGRFGHLFTADDGGNDYSIPGMTRATSTLVLDPDVRWLIVPDREIQERLPAGVYYERQDAPVGPDLVAVRIPAGSALVFEDGPDGDIAVIDAAMTDELARTDLLDDHLDLDDEDGD